MFNNLELIFYRSFFVLSLSCAFSFTTIINFPQLKFGLGLLHANEIETGPSGMLVPRFQSLRSDEVNVRRGPGHDHKILWVFRRIGMPVKIISEYKNWYQITDSEGAKGWIHANLLSRRKTVMIKDVDKKLSLLTSPSEKSEPIAHLEKGVIANLVSCEERWCQISTSGYHGWVKRNNLWGTPILPNHQQATRTDEAPETTSSTKAN